MKLKMDHSGKVTKLKNFTCTYCGSADNLTDEHVIGRRFVPKGKLLNQWNLILNVCKDCNNIKSDLEDDISAITLLPNFRSGEEVDPLHLESAKRKSEKSISRKTRQLIKDSHEKMQVSTNHPSGLSFNFKLTAPPQVSGDRIYILARYHIAAFFYLITFNQELNSGYLWPGGFYPINYSPRSDWGNSLQVTFADAVSSWEPRVVFQTADGFFKCLINKHPSENCWSWALEWNMNYRVIGFFGDKDVAKTTFASLSKLVADDCIMQGDHKLFLRSEVPLTDENDKLFNLLNDVYQNSNSGSEG